ncbi:MAG: DUF2029 domain-containing protein [Planctomycetes bacterium]|nr:DUF2029 domain-containing protein [Planctomycetota bacterium]
MAKAEPNPPAPFPKKEGGESGASDGEGTGPPGASPSPPGGRGEGASPLPLFAALLLGAFALLQALATNNFPDLFIYRIGPLLVSEGRTPYDVPLVRARVAAQFPEENPKLDSLVNNCGYFPPPLAIVVYMPFAVLPWVGAKVLWAVVTAFAAWAIAQLPNQFRAPGQAPAPRTLVWLIVPLALVFNPLAVATVVVGQTPLWSVACVVAGQMCFDRGRTWFGAALWAIPFVKPHLALPLVAVAWYLGGWKRAAAVVAIVAALNLIGATLAGGSPLYLKDYFDYLPTAHKAVLYNRAEMNPQITSWNRLLFALGGPLIELTIVTTVAGYLVWGGLVLGRVALAGERPSAAWALAAAVAGALTCCQVLGYELLALTLVVPWIRDLFAGGWKVRGWAAVLLLLSQQIPMPLDAIERASGDSPSAVMRFVLTVLGSSRPLGAMALAVLVLVGPVAPGPRADGTRPGP